MKVKNESPFPFGAKVTSRRPPAPEMTLVVRGTWLIEPREPLALPPGPRFGSQGPMSADRYADDDDERAGEPLYPGDFGDFKPNAEVLLRGTCHTPFGKPLPECPVKFAVGPWSKILRVSGPRAWSDAGADAIASRPVGFTEMPVDWAHAFGGPGFDANPVGMGIGRRELPNVEHPRHVVRERADRPVPASFGPINPGWAPRAGKIGVNYGPAWKKTRSPYYADDFDWTYFQCAPADQQIDGYLRGDETVLFQNLHPTEQLLETRLPGVRVRAFVRRRDEKVHEVVMNLDTLFADLDAGKLYLTWRGLDAVAEDDLSDVVTVLVAAEELSTTPKPLLHYAARGAEFEADPQGVRDHMPAPMLDRFEEMKQRHADAKAGKRPAAPPAPDPATGAVRAILDRAPASSPAGNRVEKETADAVAQAKAAPLKAPAGKVDLSAAQARSDASFTAIANAPPKRGDDFPVVPGGPAPAWAARAIDRAKASVQAARDAVKERNLVEDKRIEEGKIDEAEAQLERILAAPFIAKIAARPAPREPGPGLDLRAQDYADRDLRGADLSGANLEEANLSGANLEGAKLTNARLRAAVLSGANLRGADLSGADLSLANLTEVTAERANLGGATLDRAYLKGAALDDANLERAKGTWTYLGDARLPGAKARRVSLDRAFARGIHLEDADLSEAELVRCLFSGATASRVRLERATLTRSSFAKADLTRAEARGAHGARTIWLGANLDDAMFAGADLPHAELMDVRCARATFRRAILRDARCYRATFERCDFTEANLVGADFSKGTLVGSKFVGANLFDAKLRSVSGAGCDFKNANLLRALVEVES